MAVTGIGGLFFRADDPAALSAWYRTHLGMDIGAYGQWSQSAGPTVFSPFDRGSDYFPADRQWMLNLRVDDLDAMLASLRAAAVEVRTDPSWDDPSVGRFARIHDPEGNPVELWEPPVEDA